MIKKENFHFSGDSSLYLKLHQLKFDNAETVNAKKKKKKKKKKEESS